MKKELTTLREQLVSKSQELQVGRTNFLWQYGPQIQKSLFCVASNTTSIPWLKPQAFESFRGQGGLFSPLEHNLSVFVSPLHSSPLLCLILSRF